MGNMVYAKPLRILMEHKGLTKADLSKHSGVALMTIYSILNNGSKKVRRNTIKNLASALGCRLDDLRNDKFSLIDYSTSQLQKEADIFLSKKDKEDPITIANSYFIDSDICKDNGYEITTNSIIANIIKFKRIKLGINIKTASEDLSLPVDTLKKIEDGHDIKVDDLYKICDYYNVSISTLMSILE